jgi:iron complex transport system ATP-binding protein
MKLDINSLCCGYGKKEVIRDISFSIGSGESICLLGPNGVGKTTFFKTLLGLLPPLKGNITVDGADIKTLSRKEYARKIAYVPQIQSLPFPYSVEDVVLMGRNAHLSPFKMPNAKDKEKACQSLEELGITYLAKKVFTRLSGGEKQMVLIARALTQETELLFMDEPTSSLDYGNQIRILDQINKLRERGISVVMTTHAPDHVFQCGSKVIVFKEGEFSRIGEPERIVTEELLESVYRIRVKLHQAQGWGETPVRVCVPCL